MTHHTIEVTQEDIDQALLDRKDFKPPSTCCPVAKAFQRKFWDTSFVAAFNKATNGKTLFELPIEAYRFITMFDLGQTPSPFSFEAEEV